MPEILHEPGVLPLKFTVKFTVTTGGDAELSVYELIAAVGSPSVVTGADVPEASPHSFWPLTVTVYSVPSERPAMAVVWVTPLCARMAFVAGCPDGAGDNET
jgi:hypothetical protein